MKAVILGGSGFIGRELTRTMLRKGWHVVIPSRSPQKYQGMFSSYGDVDFATWDAKTPKDLAEIISGADALVNLVGENIAAGRWSDEQKARIRNSRVDAGKAVIQALEQTNKAPGVLLQGSAVGYYGTRGNEELDENSESLPAGQSFLADTARDWEASTQQAEDMGIRRVVVRTGLVLDAEGGALEKMITPFKFFLGGPVGSGRQWMPWIHRRDEVGAMVHCIEQDSCSGAYNFTSPQPVRNKEFCSELAKALGRPCWLPAPAFALKALLGEMAEELLLGGQKALPQRLLESGYPFIFPDLGQALRDIVERMQ